MYVRLSHRKASTNKVKPAIRADNEVMLSVEYSLMKLMVGDGGTLLIVQMET